MSPAGLVRRLERFRLDNGLRVVLQADPALPLVAINLWYHVGSRNERPGRTGLAHLFEHMLFQGSRHVGTNDHFRYVQQVGGVANGSTWYDRTNYYETLPSRYLDLGLWLESDRLGFLLPALTPEKLATQKEVVLNERRQRVDNQPYGRALELLHELLYPDGHPYRWPVIGYAEDIQAAEMDDVQEFFRRHYVPDNAVLTLAGDIEPQAARESVERYFGDLPQGERIEAPVDVPPPHGRPERETLTDRVELARVYFGFRCPPYGERAWYAGELLALALAGGKSSPLYEDLVYRRQMAKGVALQLLPTELDATFLMVATANLGVALADLEEAVEEHLERAARRLEPAWLERARNRLRTSWFDDLQALDRRADLISQLTTMFDDPGRIDTELERYLEIEPAEVRDFARRHLSPASRVTLRVEPRG